ncbi:hypothetical protein BY996DRAFT_6409358 [Phakopsora pachyrhizi]|nr:hypothetical protein BY996DRAFT_6409358 [Phakopsora pachyrhizi]
MQALNRDWERLLAKTSTNHREVVQGVDQVISHLELLKDLLHCDGFQVMPNGFDPILMQALNRDPSGPPGPANPSPCPTCPSQANPALYLPQPSQNQETKPAILPALALPAPAKTK